MAGSEKSEVMICASYRATSTCVAHLRGRTVVGRAEEAKGVDHALETHPALLFVRVALAHELRVSGEGGSYVRVRRLIQ